MKGKTTELNSNDLVHIETMLFPNIAMRRSVDAFHLQSARGFRMGITYANKASNTDASPRPLKVSFQMLSISLWSQQNEEGILLSPTYTYFPKAKH